MEQYSQALQIATPNKAAETNNNNIMKKLAHRASQIAPQTVHTIQSPLSFTPISATMWTTWNCSIQKDQLLMLVLYFPQIEQGFQFFFRTLALTMWIGTNRRSGHSCFHCRFQWPLHPSIYKSVVNDHSPFAKLFSMVVNKEAEA